MKIVFDNIIYALQRSGGGSVYWTELIKRFVQTQENDLFFYEHPESKQNLFRPNLNSQKVRFERRLPLSVRRYLHLNPKITSKHIFHSSYFRISPSKYSINVTTIHDLTTEKFRSGLARWVNLQQKKHAVLNSAGIICISENTKKDLLHFIPKVDPDKITVIYNGVSGDFFKISKDFEISREDERFSILDNEKYLLYIGHRTDYKNFPVAVKAAARVKDHYKLVIVGEPFSPREKQFVEQYLGKDYLQLSGLENVALNLLYNKAFALLYPSSYEGFGIPVVEAMKTHCPVIASKNSSIPEVAGDGAILLDHCTDVNIEESIRCLEDPGFRNPLIAKGVEQSKKFNWDHTCTQYLEFYKKLYHER